MSQSNLNKEGLSAVGSNADLWAMSASQKKKKRDYANEDMPSDSMIVDTDGGE